MPTRRKMVIKCQTVIIFSRTGQVKKRIRGSAAKDRSLAPAPFLSASGAEVSSCLRGRPLRLFITGFITAGFFIVSAVGFVRRLLRDGFSASGSETDVIIGAEFGRFVGMFHHLSSVFSRVLFGDCATRANLALFAPTLAKVSARAGFVEDQNSDDSGEQNDFGHSGLA